MQRRTYGAHWLAFLGGLPAGESAQLTRAAKTGVQAGCTLFEVACNPVNGLAAIDTAQSLLEGGMRQAAYCRFFPGDLSCGDPLGDAAATDQAVRTIEADLGFIQTLREQGLTVEHMTGPSAFVLGKKYPLARDAIRDGICAYFVRIGPLLASAGITLNLEYLRPGEDEDVIASMDELCLLLDRINLPYVKAHGDTFHMTQRKEVPHEAILRAANRLGYLHAHGTMRVVPGAYRLDGLADATDDVNWHQVGCALMAVGFKGPVVPEPFGATIREHVPALGAGLPPAIEARRYYDLAWEHLNREGVLTY